MKITTMRIDDRLIHGQIVTTWITYANAKQIMVVDDKAAGDKMQQMLLKFAVLNGINLLILTKEDAIKTLQEDQSDTPTLLMIRNPHEANAFIEMGFEIPVINVGNISNSKSVTGRRKMMDYIYFEEADVKALQSLNDKGIKLEVRAIPTEKPVDAMTLVNKYIN